MQACWASQAAAEHAAMLGREDEEEALVESYLDDAAAEQIADGEALSESLTNYYGTLVYSLIADAVNSSGDKRNAAVDALRAALLQHARGTSDAMRRAREMASVAEAA